MGLNSKSVSGENNLDGWDQNANYEQPKPVIKRQHQQQQQQQQIEKLKCPRCDSANTKFCYYNNYNREQPRHFCRTCKRHWTKGGTLRNVPEGGGRKNKRPRTSNSPIRSNNPVDSISSVFNPANESISQKPEPHNFPFLFDDPKTLVPIDPYQDLIPSSSKSGSIFLGSTSSTTSQNIYPNFLSSSFSFDGNPYSVSSSPFQQSNHVYNYIGGNEATEDSMPMTSSNSIVDQSLDVPVPTSCVMEMQSWWNWDDIDAFVSADVNNVPWINDSGINS